MAASEGGNCLVVCGVAAGGCIIILEKGSRSRGGDVNPANDAREVEGIETSRRVLYGSEPRSEPGRYIPGGTEGGRDKFAYAGIGVPEVVRLGVGPMAGWTVGMLPEFVRRAMIDSN